MSTSSEDTSTTAPTDDKPESSEAVSTPEAFLSGQHTAPRPGLFGAETFSVAGFLMLATTLFATELIAIFSRWVLTPAISVPGYDAPTVMVQGSLTGSAILAGLAVICAAVALFRAGTTTRAWARQLASATILAGILCVILAVLTFVLMPTPVYPTP